MYNNLIYLIGSLRNPNVPEVADELRDRGLNVFDDWYAAGPYADDHWRDYEKGRGHTMQEALQGAAAKNVFAFDCRWLVASSAVVLLAPSGKSAHLEFGWCRGKGKPGFVYMPGGQDDPERWDVMYQFATGVVTTVQDLADSLREALDNQE